MMTGDDRRRRTSLFVRRPTLPCFPPTDYGASSRPLPPRCPRPCCPACLARPRCCARGLPPSPGESPFPPEIEEVQPGAEEHLLLQLLGAIPLHRAQSTGTGGSTGSEVRISRAIPPRGGPAGGQAQGGQNKPKKAVPMTRACRTSAQSNTISFRYVRNVCRPWVDQVGFFGERAEMGESQSQRMARKGPQELPRGADSEALAELLSTSRVEKGAFDETQWRKLQRTRKLRQSEFAI